eukprot:scaffold1747_cov251-Pinguiococcus_pyrenoidosus.AAC.19
MLCAYALRCSVLALGLPCHAVFRDLTWDPKRNVSKSPFTLIMNTSGRTFIGRHKRRQKRWSGAPAAQVDGPGGPGCLCAAALLPQGWLRGGERRGGRGRAGSFPRATEGRAALRRKPKRALCSQRGS